MTLSLANTKTFVLFWPFIRKNSGVYPYIYFLPNLNLFSSPRINLSIFFDELSTLVLTKIATSKDELTDYFKIRNTGWKVIFKMANETYLLITKTNTNINNEKSHSKINQ